MTSRRTEKKRAFTQASVSEAELNRQASELARQLVRGDRVILEGPMGAGKTTFARALISGLGVSQPPEGSPTFAIAHEYRGARFEVIHIDLYRLKSEVELEEAGISSYFWQRPEAIVLVEWLSLFKDFESAVLKSDSKTRTCLVSLDFDAESLSSRRLTIEWILGHRAKNT